MYGPFSSPALNKGRLEGKHKIERDENLKKKAKNKIKRANAVNKEVGVSALGERMLCKRSPSLPVVNRSEGAPLISKIVFIRLLFIFQ